MIARATPKRDYYVVSREGRRLMQLALGRKTLAFIGASGKEDVAQVRHLAKQPEAEWIDLWLEHKQAA
jgi:type IV secretion system protein VirB4